MVIKVITAVTCPLCDAPDNECKAHVLECSTPGHPQVIICCDHCWRAWLDHAWLEDDPPTRLKVTRVRSVETRKETT